MNRTSVVLAISATIVVSASLPGMIAPGFTGERVAGPSMSAVAAPAKAGPFANKTMAALEVLKSELNRRFTDRQNVDFGMARMIRPGRRVHMGPLAEVTPSFAKHGLGATRRKDNILEAFVDGEWIPMNEVRPCMFAENSREKEAIATLRNGEVYAALYTVGRLDYDDGALIKPNSSGQDFAYFGGEQGQGMRAKGPAYLAQKTPRAPGAAVVAEFGRKAWRTPSEDFDAPGQDGWHYFAHKVKIPDESCMRCHANSQDGGFSATSKAPAKKIGDDIGMFVIALKLKAGNH